MSEIARIWSPVIARLSHAVDEDLKLVRAEPVGGGCINRAAILDFGHRRYFVKYNEPARADMFAAEAEGLETLGAAKAVRAPRPVCWGASDEIAYLVLEYLDIRDLPETAQAVLGRQLAALHRVTQPQFGWHTNNTIGSTPQVNTYSNHWPEFFRDLRIGFQLRLAADHGYGHLLRNGERLLAGLGMFFEDYTPPASLLHGDLWSGNVGATKDGETVIFDPAIYFGDRETDLAMTRLFGGFSPSFYASYTEAWPLAPGHEVREALYKLYHVLNHLNLFGHSYLAQSERLIDRLLAEMR